ncbi:MAG: hypothetical protein GKS05_11250 [Nitrospirales bacterium]|nr:hypothetical protein [Nitrospirales bacterium]
MEYWITVVFTDNQELVVRNAVRHTISDDMEILEIDTNKEVTIIPLKQIKYFSCDAAVFNKSPNS